MRVLATIAAVALLALAGCGGAESSETSAVSTKAKPTGPVLDGSATRLNGKREQLASYRGKVVLVVNTATDCGFTPQFDGLERLWERKRRDGLVVLGFPSNDFAQESRDEAGIGEFCKANYGVTFPMFSRTKVTGDGAAPLFRSLAALGEPSWNFNKYLVGRDGRATERWDAGTEPGDPRLVGAIDAALAKT